MCNIFWQSANTLCGVTPALQYDSGGGKDVLKREAGHEGKVKAPLD